MRLIVMTLAVCSALMAQMSWTSSQVVDFVRKSAKSSPDKDVAEYLRKVILTERFSDEALDDCIKAGAGIRTRAALMTLVEQSSVLPAAVKKPVGVTFPGLSVSRPAVGPAPPSEEEKAAVLEKVTDYARNYIKSLPNFTCNQITKRYYDPSMAQHYRLEDTIQENLSYSDGHESYKVILVNNAPSTKGHRELGGTTSEGEFGTDMRALFSPEAQTEFKWTRWITWHGRRTHEFAYRVRQENSSWSIEFEKTQRTVPGYHGFVYVDRDLNMIMRITREADDIPATFPIQNVKQETKYDFTKIGESEREFLVPVESVITSDTKADRGKYMVKNEIQFRLYRKFGTESVIKYDVADETPAPPATKKH